MKKILIVPDIHGREFWKSAKTILDNYDEAVFLGDYFDPYPYEFNDMTREELFGFTLNNAIDLFTWAKEHANVTLLMGNHDLHYFTSMGRGSRYDKQHSEDIMDAFDNYGKFKLAHVIDGVWFSHAPLTKEFLESVECEVKDKPLEIISNWMNECIGVSGSNILRIINNDRLDDLMTCSQYRGGRAMFGGPFWTDINELYSDGWYNDEMNPISNKYNVCGHTQLSGTGETQTAKNCTCFDSRSMFELAIDGDNVSFNRIA